MHIDLRGMNKIELLSPYLALLEPGSTWNDVLDIIPPTDFTMLHGQCRTVGVGGYLVGGGVNWVGTYEKYGSAAENVVRYTLVIADGTILQVSDGNTTVIHANSPAYQIQYDHGLNFALKGAGSSMGIVTEFEYKVYPEPETLPTLALVFIENAKDLENIEKASKDARYQMSIYITYLFRNTNIVAPNSGAFKILPKILKQMAFKAVEPVVIVMVDMSPKVGRITERRKAYNFLKSYGIKIALDGIFAEIIPNDLQEIGDYEHMYLKENEFKYRGFQAISSANMQGISSLQTFEKFILHHPIFGLYNRDSKMSLESGCEFCFVVIVASNRPSNQNIPVVLKGTFQYELSCLSPRIQAPKCSKVLKNVKENLRRKAMQKGDKPFQYLNTPSCDLKESFKDRYYRPGVYEKLLSTKRYWDPKNRFNHCHSIGNNNEDCCPI